MAISLIFVVYSMSTFGNHWDIEDIFEDETEANQMAERLRDEEPDKKFRVTQHPFHLKGK